MKKILVDRKNNTIVITKTFDKKASIYGSAEYNMLQNARRDNPGFTVEVAKTSSKSSKNTFNKLSYEVMEKYIKTHDDENHTTMKEYLNERGLSEEAKLNGASSKTIVEVRDWFFEKYPEVREFHEKRKADSEKHAEARRERQEQLALEAEAARINALFAA